MKKLFNRATPTVIAAQRNALNAAFSIEQVDGQPLTQSQDTTQDLWIPDRALESPLILRPNLKVTDPSTMQVYTPGATYEWYLDKVQAWDSRTLTGLIPLDWSQQNGFYYQQSNGVATGNLVVTKNINNIEPWVDDGESQRPSGVRGPVTLICVARYTDRYNVDNHTASASVMLTTVNIPEELYTVQILAPSTIEFNPFVSETSRRSVTAAVQKGKDTLSASALAGIKFFWYLNDVLIPTDGSFAGYVSGQGTPTLTLDLDYIESGVLKVMIADDVNAVAPISNVFDTRSIMWAFSEVEAEPYCQSGSAVFYARGTSAFDSIIRVRGKDLCSRELLEKADRGDVLTNNEQAAVALFQKRLDYLRLEWVTKDVSSSNTVSKGFGRKSYINNSELVSSVNKKTEVKLVPYAMGTLEGITCNDEAVTAGNDNENVYARR